MQTGRGVGAETGSRGGEDSWQGGAGGLSKMANCGMGQARLQLADPTRWGVADPVAPHSHIDKPGGTLGEQSRLRNPELQCGEIKPQICD